MVTDFLLSGDAKPLQCYDHGLAVVLCLQGGEQLLPEQPPELMLSRGGREGSSLVACLLALYTGALEAQGGQAGIGGADQMLGWSRPPDRDDAGHGRARAAA
jgi:hypothetical protein